MSARFIREETSNKLAVALALLSVGFTLMTFGYSGYIDSMDAQNKIDSYMKLLKQELYLNYQQAVIANEQYVKDKKLSFVPAYRDSIYQSGLNNGHFYEIDADIQTDIIGAYTLVSVDEKSISRLRDIGKTNEYSAALNGQAVGVKALLEKPTRQLRATNNSLQAGLFSMVVIVGILLQLVAIFSTVRLLAAR